MKGPPIYTHGQVERLLSLPKVVRWEAWSRRLQGRQTLGELSTKIEVWPKDANDVTIFWVESRHRTGHRVKTSFTLYGQLPGRPGHPLCRYDVQDQKHTNHPRWFEPRWVMPLVAHR